MISFSSYLPRCRSFLLLTCLFFWKAYSHESINENHKLLLPVPTGTYKVGTKAIEVTDKRRTMHRGKGPRRWVIQAFYPLKANIQPTPPLDVPSWYMPGTLDQGSIENKTVYAHAKPMLPSIKVGRQEKTFSNYLNITCMRNSDIIEEHGLPVVLFVPGFGEERQKYTILCEELASHGYVVMSFDAPYISSFVQFFDRSCIVPTIKDIWKIPRDRDYRYKVFDEALSSVIDDLKTVIENLNEIGEYCFLNYEEEQKFVSPFDKNKIIIMGHSFGGNVAHSIGFTNERITAVVDIDSKITERAINGCVGVPPNNRAVPVLFIRGVLQYQESDTVQKLTTYDDATVWAPEVEHSAFSDQAYLTKIIPNCGHHGTFYKFLHWFFKQGPHFNAIDTGTGSLTVDEWYAQYRSHIVKWLKKHTAGDKQ